MKSNQARIDAVYLAHRQALGAKTDLMFAALFVLQWAVGIILALLLTPKTWAGESSSIHIHLLMAIFLGGIAAGYPFYLVLRQPGSVFNRYVIAIAQMIFSMLLIHLTGGRVETHFHIFGSLALLAFYYDWKTLAVATVVTALDHLLRGIFFPQSVYGVLAATPWRALEHSGWVLFEDIFLFLSIHRGLETLRALAEKQVGLEDNVASIEQKVEERTRQLMESQTIITLQQQSLIASAKMSALGEMAGGIAHEINNPLAIIQNLASQVEEEVGEESMDKEFLMETASTLVKMTERIAKIVQGLRSISRDGNLDSRAEINVKKLFEETLGFCRERFKNNGIDLFVDEFNETLCFEGREVQISQVILNLLNNSSDAIATLEEKWIRIFVTAKSEHLEIRIMDSGRGIAPALYDKIFQPFFTSKEIGKGTGLGLSISLGIIREHQGDLQLDKQSANTCFVIRLPLQTQSYLKNRSFTHSTLLVGPK